MREIIRLADKVNQGTVGIETLQKMLAFERKIITRVTLPTLGTFSHDYINRNAQAEAELTESRQAAIRNIPIIEKLLTQLGGDVNSPETQPELDTEHKNYSRHENVQDGNGFGL